MLTFTIWLLVTTLPSGGVFIDGRYETQSQCERAATTNQECTEATVMRKGDD